MKAVFIGCVQLSYSALELVLSLKEIELIGVVTRKESSFNADFRSLAPLAEKAGVECIFARGNNQEKIAAHIKRLEPDVIYCFGWSYLLRKEILKIPRLGVIGYHPAGLPQNRGRHPLIWALALGLRQTGSTFFIMDEGADSGDILDQRMIKITPSDDASSLYEKITESALDQIAGFTPKLASGNFERKPQDHSQANYWRKRGKLDGQVDWRMSARVIHNLVRALTRPYIGATCVFQEEDIKIWKTEIVHSGEQSENIEPGKVLSADGSAIVVKCGEGAVKLVEHEFHTIPRKGGYL